jgi:hypothetical protein
VPASDAPDPERSAERSADKGAAEPQPIEVSGSGGVEAVESARLVDGSAPTLSQAEHLQRVATAPVPETPAAPESADASESAAVPPPGSAATAPPESAATPAESLPLAVGEDALEAQPMDTAVAAPESAGTPVEAVQKAE